LDISPPPTSILFLGGEFAQLDDSFLGNNVNNNNFAKRLKSKI